MDDFNERDIWQEKDTSRFLDQCLALAFGGCIGGAVVWIIYALINWGGK